MVDVAKVKMFGMNVGSFSWDYAYNPNGALDQYASNVNKREIWQYYEARSPACASTNNIKNASDIINQVCQAVAEWPRIAKTCDVPQEMIDARFQYMLLDI